MFQSASFDGLEKQKPGVWQMQSAWVITARPDPSSYPDWGWLKADEQEDRGEGTITVFYSRPETEKETILTLLTRQPNKSSDTRLSDDFVAFE